MLHIHFSNRFELLADQLLARLAAPRENTGLFVADAVIVPSAAVRRAFTLGLAREQGLCANVQFAYLAPWMWQQMGALLPGLPAVSPFALPLLTWRVHALLCDADFVAAHPRLASYLGGADPVMRFDLAGRMAGVLDQTLTYRPDWLQAWRQGRAADVGAGSDSEHADERWQRALWQRLAASVAPGAALPAIGADLIPLLADVSPAQARAAGMPASAHLLALPTMPALHIAWLQQIGRLVDLHLYVLNPCQEYWFELIDRRRLSHLALRAAKDERAQHQEEGNRLLVGWGRQTQALVDALVDSAGELSTDDADFSPHPGHTLLAQLHNAMLDLIELAPGSLQLAADDRSVELHVCHSLTRELEALQDHLLGLFARGELSHPSQIVVVTPDLDAAAPLIDAVFGTVPRDRHIPYTLSGRARSTVSAPARAFLALLALAGSRWSASEVFGLLQQPIVARRFKLDDADLSAVHGWLLQAGVRWGLDGSHRQTFGVPGTPQHTWSDALDRLFLGYALPTQVQQPFAGLLPAGDVQGSEALALGACWRFVQCLRALHADVASAHPPARWRSLLLEAAAQFLAPAANELEDQRELLAAIRELTLQMEQGADAGAPPVAVPLAVLRVALAQQLDGAAPGGVPGGGVTFSSMSSLRGLPFDVVCIIGLNDGAFPTQRQPPEFDLMRLKPRRGDRQRRVDERNLFLDLLLAARHSLYLSHTGRSVRDNAPLPPSVLVSELLDVLLPAIADDPAAPESLLRARQRLVVEHPLQAFSVSAFDPNSDGRQRSFNGELAQALRAGATPGLDAAREALPLDTVDEVDEIDEGDVTQASGQAGLPPFFAGPLRPPEAAWRELSVDQLVAFFRNPCRYLLQQRLGLALGRDDDELQDDEPLVADWPGRQALAARLMPALLDGAGPEAALQLALAGLERPAGALGRQWLDQQLQQLGALAQAVRAATQGPALEPHALRLDFQIEGERWRLLGDFADLRPAGLLRWRADELRPADRLAAWIVHLALCAAPPAGVQPQTLLLSLDPPLRLAAPEQPQQLLGELLALYRRGLREPLRFFPKSAWALVESGGIMSAAEKIWTPTQQRPFAEGADAAYRLALRGREAVLDAQFVELAHRVFEPLIKVMGNDQDRAVPA